MEDAFQRGAAVDGGVVLGEHGDYLLLRVEPAANVLQDRDLAILQGHTTG